MSDFELTRAHPLSRLLSIAIDYQTGTATFVRDDLMVATATVALPTNRGAAVTSSTFFPKQSRIVFKASGRTLTMNLGTLSTKCDAPTVYLDQRDWIHFARWEKEPNRVTPAQRQFFGTLATAVESEQVIVPISAAHLVETSKRGGASRLDLAATMLRYSRGWQVRSVLALRRAELRALFGGEPLVVSDVVTLAPQAALDMERPAPFAPELGSEMSGLIERQVWAAVLVELLLDPVPTPNGGQDLAHQWSQSFLPLATAIPGNAKARARIRDLTRVRFISDLGHDLPAAAKEAGLTPGDFSRWLTESAERDIAATPGLSRLRETLHLRIANATEKWEANDLNDWFYLSYSGAYLDLVLGERKTINYLRRVDPLVPSGAKLHYRAEDALADLQHLLA
ncbi:hypothetical protein [Cellulomonas soli]|uniref:Uncharacterized protein n=1 Tax=Cellulomonas soli TaxID=931535 RepID=A0A512PH01_9CELL|nr:hypothetical protein [Cellulomonas soli]NYI59618.1 hypothetical protein [Cellulomonas soli]GEP70412.1 hypothetical protein CSO01_31270 [Cellulomonas soli]